MTTAYSSRFNFKQLQEAILVQKDGNSMFNACIKVHSVVIQKGLSYRRLFNQWKDKGSRSNAGAGRLSEKELVSGLKKLRAGLTSDEIEKLCSSLPYDVKDHSIGFAEFETEVKDNARKLEAERGFERMILQEWISCFNECLDRFASPIERLFYEHDTD